MAVDIVARMMAASAQSGEGSSDYEDLDNKPKINGVELEGNKSLSDIGIDASIGYDSDEEYGDGTIGNALKNKVNKEENKGLSSNDYTTAEKEKLADIQDITNEQIDALF